MQLQQADIRGKEKAARKLNKAIDEVLQNAPSDQKHSALQDKKDEMNNKIRATQANAKEKENKLQESMREVRRYY